MVVCDAVFHIYPKSSALLPYGGCVVHNLHWMGLAETKNIKDYHPGGLRRTAICGRRLLDLFCSAVRDNCSNAVIFNGHGLGKREFIS
jgi:hypothetical protein